MGQLLRSGCTEAAAVACPCGPRLRQLADSWPPAEVLPHSDTTQVTHLHLHLNTPPFSWKSSLRSARSLARSDCAMQMLYLSSTCIINTLILMCVCVWLTVVRRNTSSHYVILVWTCADNGVEFSEILSAFPSSMKDPSHNSRKQTILNLTFRKVRNYPYR